MVTNRDGVQYCTPLQKLLLAMVRVGQSRVAAAVAAQMAPRDGGDDDAAAAVALGLREHWPAPAGFEQLPAAVQKMWVHSNDAVKFREQAGAVIAAYNKALEAGALESTAERAAAAAAYAIDDSGYREYIEHEKKWQLERCAAAAKLEELAMKARRLVKKARRLVSRGTLPKRLQGPCEDAFAPHRAMNVAHAILDEVCRARILVQLLEHEARLIPDGFELPYAKKEVESCLRVMDRMQLRCERAYKVARDACRPTKSGVAKAWAGM